MSEIFRYSDSEFVHHSQAILAVVVSLFSSLTPPANRLSHLVLLSVHITQVDLRIGEAFLGRLQVPNRRQCLVLWNTPSVLVRPANSRLRPHIALLGGYDVPQQASM